MKIRATIFIIFAVLVSCRKDNSSNIILNGTLTNCPANSTCSYSYYEHADYTGPNQLVNGNNRVFAYSSTNGNLCGPNAALYFKNSLSNSSFIINSSQIVAGDVMAYNFACPCCESAVLESIPVGGEIKAKKTDATHWLVNATIIFGDRFNNTPIDTLIVNQYFTLEKLP